MKAMVFAAGLGTRLRPLTDDRPKALVELAGRTLLDHTLERLRSVGVREVIVNVHHFAAKVVDHLAAHGNFGMHIEISHEQELLDTGGGLRRAGWFFTDGEPFLVHNVDVLSTIDLKAMLRAHQQLDALATLAVQQRSSSRQLLFDANRLLCGRQIAAGECQWARPEAEGIHPLAFAGVHIISPPLLDQLDETGSFSIIPAYLRLAAQGERIVAFEANLAYWRDLGKPESLAQAERDLAAGLLG